MLLNDYYTHIQPVYTRDQSQWDRFGSICIDYWGPFTHVLVKHGLTGAKHR